MIRAPLSALFFPALLLLATPAFAQTPAGAPVRSVTVSGEGKVEATPDRAILPIALETRDKGLNAAKQKNDQLTEKLLKIAADFKLPKEKLKTSGLTISPQYRWEQKTGKQVFEGYTVSRSLRLTIDQLDQTEKLIAAITEAGIDQVQGIQFTLSDPDALEAAARKSAVENAHAKAAALAEAAGAKLGKVLTITTDGSPGYAPPMPMRMMAAEAKQADAAPPTLPGTVEIQQRVTIVYALD